MFPFLSVTNTTKLERLHRAASWAIFGFLSSSPIPVLFSEAFLPSLQVNRTHFALSSYERTLCLPTSFPISGLARLGVKPRLCRSSWRAFASTHTTHSTSSREALFVCPQFHHWSLPSFTVKSTLFSPCSRPDPSLSRLGAAFAYLDSPVLWTDGPVSFSFGKGGSGVPANCFLALRPPFPFQQAQYVQVFPLKPVSFFKLFAGLGSTNKFAIFFSSSAI